MPHTAQDRVTFDARSGNILVVDGRPAQRTALTAQLQAHGFSCSAASTTAECLDQVAHCDAVLLSCETTDGVDPRPGCVRFLTTLRQHYGLDQLPVIVLVSTGCASRLAEMVAAGASDTVLEPLDITVLLARLRTWLRMKALHDTREHFMRIASHDLRNPLTRILTSAELLAEMLPPGTRMDAELYGLLGGVSDAAVRMGRIIEDFVELQILQDGGMSLDRMRVDLNVLATAALQRGRPRATDKDIRLELQPADGPLWVSVDPHRIEQVIDNFVDNAIKFSRPQTCIEVRCQLKDGAVRLDVLDQGPGLTDDDLERVFQRYSRLSARPTGGEVSSGLGLSIAREIIQLHNGQIGARNRAGTGGAAFWFSLAVCP